MLHGTEAWTTTAATPHSHALAQEPSPVYRRKPGQAQASVQALLLPSRGRSGFWGAPCRRSGSLDIVLLVCKLFIIEAKLIHEVGCHLLDLVFREGLRKQSRRHSSAVGLPHSSPLHAPLVLRQACGQSSSCREDGGNRTSGPGGLCYGHPADF